MIQFSSFNPQGFAFRSAQITIGGKTIGGFAVQSIPPNSLKSTNTMDIVDISPFARALSQSAVTQSEKYGNMTIPKDGRRIIPVRNQSNRGADDLKKGKMASLDRFLGQDVGTSYGKLEKVREKISDNPNLDIGNRPEIFAENLLYGMMTAKAEDERNAIQHDMKKLLKEKGIDVKDAGNFSFTVSKDGVIQIDSISVNLEGWKSRVEEILNEDKSLALRMVKNSAMFKLQDYRYDDGGSASKAEMALVNVALLENFGFGLDKLGEAGVGNVWGFNAELDAAMADDALFEEQIFTYLGSAAEFDVKWSFGNGYVADTTNSANSFLPKQLIGTFAEKLYMDTRTRGSEIKFALTPDGQSKVLDATSEYQEYSAEDREYAMKEMEGLLSEGAANGGLEPLKEASKRALEEHLVKNGGTRDNLEVVITARDGQWSIEVEEKGIAIKLPEEEEREKEKKLSV